MSNKWEKSPPELIEFFYSIMERFPEAEQRKMFGYPCAFYNGNMFVGLHQRDMIVRLEKEEVERAFKAKKGKKFEPLDGRVMKEYLALGQEVLSDPEHVEKLIAKSLAYVKTLPRKVKKKRSTGKSAEIKS